jgi:hypothetical protein
MMKYLHSKDIFVVVSCTEINHHVFVSVKKHDCARIIQLIHFVEIWYLSNVHLKITN